MSDLILPEQGFLKQDDQRPAMAEHILKHGYAVVPFKLDRAWIKRRIIKPFTRLTKLTPEQQKRWLVDLSKDRRPDHSFFRREDGPGDWKSVYQFREWGDVELGMLDRLRHQGVQVGRYKQWFQSMGDLSGQLLELAVQVAEGFDMVCPEFAKPGQTFAGVLRQKEAMNQHVLRLLSYDAKARGGQLADEHLDYAFITVAVLESHRGLCFGNMDIQHMYKSCDGWVVVFVGRKMHEFTNGRILALPHGVLSPDKDITRYATVFFAHSDVDNDTLKAVTPSMPQLQEILDGRVPWPEWLRVMPEANRPVWLKERLAA